MLIPNLFPVEPMDDPTIMAVRRHPAIRRSAAIAAIALAATALALYCFTPLLGGF